MIGPMVSLNVTEPYRGVSTYRCPCCNNRTLHERGGHDICPVCFWQDDGQDDHDADTVRGGPNKALSLTAARQNYLRCGASDHAYIPHVRPPTIAEAEAD